MDQIIIHLTEIARLVPTQSISIELIHTVYPEGKYTCPLSVTHLAVSSVRAGLSLQQSKGVNLLLTIVSPCCGFHGL
jgi:phosphate/sulfate permease